MNRDPLALYTNAPGYARALLPVGARRVPTRCGGPAAEERPLVEAMLGDSASVYTTALDDPLWRHVLVSGFAAGSQYDRMIRLGREGVEIPDAVACVARTGGAFQGFRGRSWVGRPGNIHLTVHLAPGRPIERFGSVFMALAAVSVVDAIDAVPGLDGRASIKWVNDVLLGGAKVGGVLVHTQTRGDAVTAVVLGIGLNVETTPAVAPTAFVPAVGSLRDFAADPARASEREVLGGLLRALARNYRTLLDDGYRPLMERYRARSAVLGREVLVSSDEADEVPRIRAAGRVAAIGDGLELRLAGRAQPVTNGRLIFGAADVPATGGR